MTCVDRTKAMKKALLELKTLEKKYGVLVVRWAIHELINENIRHIPSIDSD